MKKLNRFRAVLTVAGLLCPMLAHGQSSEDARLQKLEAAVQQLQQSNAALQQSNSRLQHQVADMTVSGSNGGMAGVETPEDTSAKFKLSKSVQEMDLYGEMRLRYFFNQAAVANSSVSGDRNRFRYRMRLGDNIKFTDNLSIGILVEANNSAHSANVTLGNSASNAPDSEVFNKGVVNNTVTSVTGTKVTGFDPNTGKIITGTATATGNSTGSTVSSVNFQDAIFFSQVYMKYTPFPWVTLEGGKLPNPFVTSRMVWDPDINPEGLAEKFSFTLGPWGKAPAATDGKDAKEVADAELSGPSLDLFGNFGQFIYEDDWTNNFNVNSTDGELNSPEQSDIGMFEFQVGGKYHFNKDTSFQVAPSFYTYTGVGSAFAGKFSGDGPSVVIPTAGGSPTLVFPNEEAVNDLAVLDIPAEFDWKMWNVPFRVFGEFADNLEAESRASGAAHPHSGGQGKAYQIGAGIGRINHGGDWELLGYYQRSEQYALDPNIVDDDIFNGRLNMQGFYLQLTYAFTDAFSLILQGSRGTQVDSALGTAGSGALGEPEGLPLKQVSQFYVDLSLKF